MQVFLIVVVSLIASVYASAAEYPGGGSLKENEATELAYATLSSAIGAGIEDITLIHISRFSWPDSAIGCPKPGLQYTQAIVPGFLALLDHGNKKYRIHIGNGRAVVCDLARIPLKLGGVLLDDLKKLAKEDLAARLGVETAAIDIVEVSQRVWPDTNFGCQANATERVQKTIRGHLIKLDHNNRVYEYRTSRTHVLPCPAILTE